MARVGIYKKPVHDWLRQLSIAFVPGPMTTLLDGVVRDLLARFSDHGHLVNESPRRDTELLITTASYGEPLRWRDSVLFTARRRFKLRQSPVVFTLIHMGTEQFKTALDRFAHALSKERPDRDDYALSGLNPDSELSLHEQGRRGGPITVLMRQLQTQALSVRVVLVVGDEVPVEAYTFDLVGAYPRTTGGNWDEFYDDILTRMVTAASTDEITNHLVEPNMISKGEWAGLSAPEAMVSAGRELGRRDFFTETIRISSLIPVPAVDGVISSQYSEGCFATWEPRVDGLIVTVTGSARPIDKFQLGDDELAVIVGVTSDRKGALIRHVEGKRNDPPSSEAVEMIEMDMALPRIALKQEGTECVEVPVSRSKLHGHRGIRAYDPRLVEYVPLDEPYLHYPVSCSTEAQAYAIKAAFARSQALREPEDARQVVFTVLPGHGIVVVEKWVNGKRPFQTIWEYMDRGYLAVETRVPQGPLAYRPGPDGRLHIHTEEAVW